MNVVAGEVVVSMSAAAQEVVVSMSVVAVEAVPPRLRHRSL